MLKAMIWFGCFGAFVVVGLILAQIVPMEAPSAYADLDDRDRDDIRAIVQEEVAVAIAELCGGVPGPSGPTGPTGGSGPTGPTGPTGPPDPPPEGDISRGYRIPSGVFENWTTRWHVEKDCMTYPGGNRCVRFHSDGRMGSNTWGCYYLGPDEDGQGCVSFKVRFNSETRLGEVDGTHLFGLVSYPLVLAPASHPTAHHSSSRVDFGSPGRGGGLVVYAEEWDSNGNRENFGKAPKVMVGDWEDCVGKWISISLCWKRSGDKVEIWINGEWRKWDGFEVATRSPGVYFYCGNFDKIWGEFINFKDFVYEP